MSESEEDAAKKNWELSQHSQNMQSAGEQFEHEKAQYLQKLTRTGMSDAEIDMLDNMVDRSFVLGNLKDAEVHEIKWRLHTLYLKIKAQFPPQDSDITGKIRAFVYDDPDEKLDPLTDQQRNIIAQMLIGIHVYVSRSRDGFQQEMMVKSINVSEVQDPDDDEEDSVMSGFFN